MALGCHDLDLKDLKRSAPKVTKCALFELLQVFATGLFASAAVTTKQLSCKATGNNQDAKDLFMSWPPRDPITFKCKLYEVIGNMYGFADAPLIFSWVVRTRMYGAGIISHTLDVMALILHDGGNLVCMVIVHVDDCLFTASPTFDLRRLLDLFTWGSLTFAPDEITFLNRQVSEPHKRRYWSIRAITRLGSKRASILAVLQM